MKKINKQVYTKGFFAVVAVLAVVRLIFPSVSGDLGAGDIDKLLVSSADSLVAEESEEEYTLALEQEESKPKTEDAIVEAKDEPEKPSAPNSPAEKMGEKKPWKKHKIYGVHSYSKAFPDLNDVQLSAARKLGVSPVQDREEAEHRMNELVYMGSSPYYHVDKLTRSEPYLVPEAALLLHDIGRAFFDSLQAKGIPLHKPIVTSVLRTRENIKKLRRHNVNATENSCHLYGTTFDITYLRYQTVSPPDEPQRRMVRNDTLKWVLSEVMRDMREQGRCYVKYEVKQACFHATVRK